MYCTVSSPFNVQLSLMNKCFSFLALLSPREDSFPSRASLRESIVVAPSPSLVYCRGPGIKSRSSVVGKSVRGGIYPSRLRLGCMGGVRAGIRGRDAVDLRAGKPLLHVVRRRSARGN
jgi:hypothetical protein